MGLGSLRNEPCRCGTIRFEPGKLIRPKKYKECHYSVDVEMNLHGYKYWGREVSMVQDIILAYQQMYITNDEAKKYIQAYLKKEIGEIAGEIPEATIVTDKVEDDNKEV